MTFLNKIRRRPIHRSKYRNWIRLGIKKLHISHFSFAAFHLKVANIRFETKFATFKSALTALNQKLEASLSYSLISIGKMWAALLYKVCNVEKKINENISLHSSKIDLKRQNWQSNNSVIPWKGRTNWIYWRYDVKPRTTNQSWSKVRDCKLYQQW